jgi:hypothetical protein
MNSNTERASVKVWSLRCGSINDYAPLVFSNERDVVKGLFDVSGAPLTWQKRPKVEVFIEPGKKKPKPRADISALTPGALALNERAKEILDAFLSQFGEFLEMDCNGERCWFYNVTNLVSCIDQTRSEKKASGVISKEIFLEERVPIDASVFKDPLTAAASLYVNEHGKSVIEKLIASAGLTGAAFVEPGPPPRKPRPQAP